MFSFIKQRASGFMVATAWLVADILTKSWALAHLRDGSDVVVPGLLNFHLAFNRGISFSMLRDVDEPIKIASYTFYPEVYLPLMLAFVAFVASVFFIWWMGREPRHMFQIGTASILGGAVGNLIDRLQHGAVVDFIDFYYSIWHWPTFNIADTAITVGVMLLITDSIVEWWKQKKA